MRPADANPADYRLYYNGTYMQHAERGPVRIAVEGGRLYGKPIGGRNARMLAEALTALWARPGAYNIGETAFYLGRKARRSARRSMSTEHYNIMWSSVGTRISNKYLEAALKHDRYPTLAAALRELKRGKSARAISREIILAKTDTDAVKVVFRGQVAGKIENGLFVPRIEAAPLAKLARVRLAAEGILC